MAEDDGVTFDLEALDLGNKIEAGQVFAGLGGHTLLSSVGSSEMAEGGCGYKGGGAG